MYMKRADSNSKNINTTYQRKTSRGAWCREEEYSNPIISTS